MFNSFAAEFPTSARSEKAISMVAPTLKKQLSDKGLEYGAPIFIRIFKDPGILEVWLESDDGTFIHFKNYEICTFSGDLGPKLKEGDNQSPEGFYYVDASGLNPWSNYHLSFNLGFPNKYDRTHNRTGSALMVHGNCVSIGCYAMTDEYINEIYALGAAALKSGQSFLGFIHFRLCLRMKFYQSIKQTNGTLFGLTLKKVTITLTTIKSHQMLKFIKECIRSKIDINGKKYT
ncbi:L,D-transpeptidase family protein [Pseudoalteromonas sp. B62]|uniref:L,D-transpeptidase family protein n=1 Tax=Pseudoalteromonas sp. B62 TaxID=630483 RepID=UPI00301CCBAA